MKNTAIILLCAFILCSFGNNKKQTVQRRKGVMTMNQQGSVVFTPLEDYKDFTPVNDTLYQYKVK